MTLFGRRRDSDHRRSRRIDVLQRGSVSSRRRLVGGAVVAVLALAAIPVVLAVQQYGGAKARAARDLQARVVAVGGILDTYFQGQVATLDAIAGGRAVADEDPGQMKAVFRRIAPAGSSKFSGGIGWIDRSGRVRASSRPSGTAANLSDRVYFRRALATRSPYISAGLIGRTAGQPTIVVAVPTFGPSGDVTGVLAGSILLKPARQSRQAFDLGFGDVQVVDRNGRLLMERFRPITNRQLLTRLHSRSSGVFTSTEGLEGRDGHVVAFANSRIPDWVTVIDRSRASVFAPARRALGLQLGSVGVGVLLVLLSLAFVARRVRREGDSENARAHSWAGLSRALAGTTSPAEVAEALLRSLALAFPDRAAVVALDSGRDESGDTSRVIRGRRLGDDAATLEWIAQLGEHGPATVPLERDGLPPIRHLPGTRRLRVVHCVPVTRAGARVAGTISLIGTTSRLEPSEWALLTSFAEQAVRALERAWRFQHQHELAAQLQRSLLPELLPSGEGLSLAGHYSAGADAVEVGGDWYAAVRRPDGVVHVCVGDVSGKGVAAATVMSRKRRTFEIYAQDNTSPAEIVRRMLRHVDGQEMVTLTIVSLDPFTGDLAYTRVGHLPPLVVDRASGEVTKLDGAGAPPLGVAEPADITEQRLTLPDEATVVLYTDGLVERRGADIDDAIDLLGDMVAEDPALAPGKIVTKVGSMIGAGEDDVALLVVSFDATRLPFEVEIPADPELLSVMRRRLRAWLERRGLDRETTADLVLAVSEACSNAIEHGYRDGESGPIRVAVVLDAFSVQAVVEDRGTWRDGSAEEGRGRGRGLGLMELLTDTRKVETGPNGTRVVLARRVRARTSPGTGLVPATQGDPESLRVSAMTPAAASRPVGREAPRPA